MGSIGHMNSEVIVIGAGGHAKVCIELLHAMGEKVAFCVGNGSDSPDLCLGIPVLKGDDNLTHLRKQGHFRAFVAVGSNSLRARLGTIAADHGYQLVNAVSPHAIISPSAKLGIGIAVMAGAVINADVSIGDFSIINTGATIDHDCRIGKAVHIAPQCALAGNVIVGDYSFLGIGTKVIPETQIGQQVITGAGAVVVSHIESGSKAVGVPAKATRE